MPKPLKSLGTSNNHHYSLRLLVAHRSSAWYVLRECDEYGEYPSIFIKCFYKDRANEPWVILLSDTGTGFQSPDESYSNSRNAQSSSKDINIASFIEERLNKDHKAPYVIISTHCHYDHILGIRRFQEAGACVTILVSSFDVTVVKPWENLQKNSLCEKLGLVAPHYEMKWLNDLQMVYLRDLRCALLNTAIDSKVSIIHTPGHTADSLSWYDQEYNILCVGDTFYERESEETRSGSNGLWAREPPQPIIFPVEGDLVQWKSSLHRLLSFVRVENERLETWNGIEGDCKDGICCDSADEQNVASMDRSCHRKTERVSLCAGHVTILTDAEKAIEEVLEFMHEVEQDQVPKKMVLHDESGGVWLWDYAIRQGLEHDFFITNPSDAYRYSLKGPWKVIHPGST